MIKSNNFAAVKPMVRSQRVILVQHCSDKSTLVGEAKKTSRG